MVSSRYVRTRVEPLTYTSGRLGKRNTDLCSYEVGEVRWVERTGVQPPIPASTRRPPETRGWLFEATAHLAVPQSSLVDEPVRLWRIKRIA